jgi:hypothetical protein
MPNQEQSKDGIPRKDGDRPSPDVERNATDGQSNSRGKGATDEQGAQKGSQDYRGDGPGKMGLASSQQPDLVSPSGVNERDHGSADDKPMGGGTVNLDDDPMDRPRGNNAGTGGTWDAQGGDSGRLGPPGAGLSGTNGPSDPDSKTQ